MEEVVKCKNVKSKNGSDRTCDRYLLKIIDRKQINVKCSSCGSNSIITVTPGGELDIVHIKKGEEILCQQKCQ